VWASYKFRDTKTGTIPATSVTSHAIDADLDAFDQTMEQLTRDGVRGPHRKGYEHEEDAKAAAASGNPTQLNAAVTYCIDRRKTQAKAAGLQTFQCWTGYDLLNREPLYRVSGQRRRRHHARPVRRQPARPVAGRLLRPGLSTTCAGLPRASRCVSVRSTRRTTAPPDRRPHG
jgi:hypothetical protein